MIFPEGDIYHTTDIVTPFREGAAAIALSAAKRSQRPLVVIPCAIRFQHVDDPTPALRTAVASMEQRLYLRSHSEQPLVDRVHTLAEAALALKELDYLGAMRSGRVRERVAYLIEAVLQRMEQRHALKVGEKTPPERIKALRQYLISQLEFGPDTASHDDASTAVLGT